MENEEIRVVEHDPAWGKKYRREAALLEPVFSKGDCEIEHIGSTAVDGLAAKPIIDIAIRIPTVADIPNMILPLAALGYQYEGEFGLPGRHFFTRGKPREYHLHIVDDTTDHWERWITFRDLLRRDPGVREEYLALKLGLADRFRAEREKYTAGKANFINAIVDAQRDGPGTKPGL